MCCVFCGVQLCILVGLYSYLPVIGICGAGNFETEDDVIHRLHMQVLEVPLMHHQGASYYTCTINVQLLHS